jgi:hypothetical protein
MSNVISFPQAPTVEVIDEAFFEKFADAALLMTCFETIANAVEVVEEGVKIHERDETHVSLLEACMALSVLFRRRTGHSVQHVSADHLEQQRQALLAGEALTSLPIPIQPSALNPLPATAFSGLADLELAQAGFSYVRRVSELIEGNCPQLAELSLARAHSVDALNAFSVLIARLAGGAAQDFSASLPAVTGPSSETLQ